MLHMYHRIDREVFARLVITHKCYPVESLLVIAVWLWIEEKGFLSLISKMSKLLNQMVNFLAREAVSSLNYLKSEQVPNVPPNGGIYFTSQLLDRTDMSLLFFYHNWFSAIVGVKNVLNSVGAKIFTYILPLVTPISMAGFPHQYFGDVEIMQSVMNYVEIPKVAGGDQILQLWSMPVIPENVVFEDDWSMFLTYSRGFRNFRQKDLSIAEYTAEFDNLMLKGDLMEPEEQTIARYLGGLNYEISNVVQLQPYWTFNDVCKLAFKVEKQQKEIRGNGSKYGSREGFSNKGTNLKFSAATKTISKSTSNGDGVVVNKQQPSSSNTSSRRDERGVIVDSAALMFKSFLPILVIYGTREGLVQLQPDLKNELIAILNLFFP
ncbi:hypothetical protein EZV62_015867 [Acer yangbiense]|uniref:Uncharacterized protein n=1 Tax=Acer yangbiense TaxID=1000413 RepID=A0A5C7HME6_9ROSI|nr:hypothetical protein EZV62_015867 [Acer yangbiense]